MNEKHTIDIFEGVEAEVVCYFQPEEKAETGPEARDPGCEAEFYVEEVFIKGEDVTHFFSEEGMAEILEKVKASLPEPDFDEDAGKRWTSRY